MTKKEQCKEVMSRLFGPAAASQVDEMTEEDCLDKCKQRVENFLGQATAEKEFEGL